MAESRTVKPFLLPLLALAVVAANSAGAFGGDSAMVLYRSFKELLSGTEVQVGSGCFDFKFETPDTRIFMLKETE